MIQQLRDISNDCRDAILSDDIGLAPHQSIPVRTVPHSPHSGLMVIQEATIFLESIYKKIFVEDFVDKLFTGDQQHVWYEYATFTGCSVIFLVGNHC